MAFEAISDLARSLIRDGIEQRGVVDGLNTDTRLRADGIGGGLTNPGEAVSPPIAQAAERATTSNSRMGKMGRAVKPGPSGFGVEYDKEPSPNPRARPVLRLVMGGRERHTVNRRNGQPRPAVLRPMLSIVGGTAHATLP